MATNPQTTRRITRKYALKSRKGARIVPAESQEDDIDDDSSGSRKRHKRYHKEDTNSTPAGAPCERLECTSSAPIAQSRGTTVKPAKESKSVLASIPTSSSSQSAPDNWKEVYDTIKDMRSRITTAADKFGCEQSKRKERDPKNSRFTTLVYLMLSSQTKDEVTDTAVTKLKNAVGGTLSIDAVIAADESVISESINKVGFWRRKSGYIKRVAYRLRDDFESDVPKTLGELCSLPGVGPKMAILALHVAWDINQGIGIDSHVHRLTNRLGWHRKPTKNAEETRMSLQSWLPSELHREVNLMLVGFGQAICTPSNPHCDMCELSVKGLCPSAQRGDKRNNWKRVAASAAEVSVEYEKQE